MSLSLEEVARVAKLARIELTPAEIDVTRTCLNDIFGFIEQLQAAATDGVAPMAHAVEMTQRLRPDRVTETDRREIFQLAAPETEGGLYLVPKVIE